jgi:ribosomal protein S18 acetylase RimI-like enzyme
LPGNTVAKHIIVCRQQNPDTDGVEGIAMKLTLRDYMLQTDFEDVFSFARELLSEPPYHDAREELSAYPRRKLSAKVAISPEGAIVGFCAATREYWNSVAIIDYLVVHPEIRCQGIGSLLVSAVESELREAGIRVVCVQTASWNTRGIKFYERLGYVQRAVFPEYLGQGNDLVWLDRNLL